MIRSIFFALILVFSFGCSSATSNNVRAESASDKSDDAFDALHEAHTAPKCINPQNTEFTCEFEYQGQKNVVNSQEDISKFDGYHVIAFVKDDNGNTFAHVADTCQHYFCAVDMSPPSDTQCKQPKVRTVGCCLAHPVKKANNSNK